MSTRKQSFTRLKNGLWKQQEKLQEGVKSSGGKIQSLSDGHGEFVYDEYSFIMTALPLETTVKEFVRELATNLNSTINDAGFTAVNRFIRTSEKPPAVGEIVNIDIIGPDNGSVILAELGDDYFVYQTITTPKDGLHPEAGVREFGVEQLEDKFKVYTRGISRPQQFGGAIGAFPVRLIGGAMQTIGWTRMMRGISDTVKTRGGTVGEESFNCLRQSAAF